MIPILALVAGITSWILLDICIVKGKTLTNEKFYRLQSISWMFCAISLYIPSLCQYMELRVKDYDSIIDCTATYHLASAVVLIVTLTLTIISILLKRKYQ